MRKPAESDHALHELIRERWSPIAFANQSIAAEQLGSLLEAARWAPSCFNEQPWRFVLARREEEEAFARLGACLVPANWDWAQHAAALVLTAVAEHFAHNDKPNAWAQHDLGLATAQLILQAQAFGIAAHLMAGFDGQKARDLLGIPEGFTPVTAMALGYASGGQDLEERQQARHLAPRQRRSLASIAFSGRWEQPLSP